MECGVLEFSVFKAEQFCIMVWFLVWQRNSGRKAMSGTDIKKFEAKVLDGFYPNNSGELRGFR